jgi:hypothetical protein
MVWPGIGCSLILVDAGVMNGMVCHRLRLRLAELCAVSYVLDHLCCRLCTIAFSTYTYTGLAHPDEVAFACSIALQAYFEGRAIIKEDMDLCIKFWRENILEEMDLIRSKRQVCLEPYYVPCPECSSCHALCHPSKSIPYEEDLERHSTSPHECIFLHGDFHVISTIHTPGSFQQRARDRLMPHCLHDT